GAIAGLVLDGGVPPAVVEHDVARRREVEPGAAGLQREHERPGTLAVLELVDDAVALGPGEAAVVAGDGPPEPLGEVGREPLAPAGEVREDQHSLARGVDALDDLLEPGELA